MTDESKERAASEAEQPKVFRVAQLPAAGGPSMDRRTFVKGTLAAASAGAMMTVLSGCEDDDDGDKCVCNTVCPCEGVGACECDLVVCQCQWGCGCHTVCPCESVSACECDAVQTICKAPSEGADYTTWVSSTCTCNTVAVCTCEGVCSCVGHCSCDGQGGGGGGHYWYPC
jgi:hypothetical protein